jgi:PAS domain S-box-containing protein
MWPANNNKRPIFLQLAGWLSISLVLGVLVAFWVQSRICRAPVELYLEKMAVDLSREISQAVAEDVWNLDEKAMREYFSGNIWRHLGVNSVRVLTEFEDEIYTAKFADEPDHIFHRQPVFHKGKVIGYVETFVSKNRLFVLQNALDRLGVIIVATALVMVLMVCMILVRLIIIRPLQKTIAGLRKIASGEYGYRLTPGRTSEIDQINQEINIMSVEILNRRNLLESEIVVRRKAEQALSALNEALDQRVKDRTQQLEESEKRFRTLFEEAGDAIILVDIETHNIVDSNKAASGLLGYTQGELHQLNIVDFYQPVDFSNILELLQKTDGSDSLLVSDIPIKQKGGGIVHTDINAFYIRIKGKQYLAGFFRDVTARNSQEQLRLEHQRQLRRMAGMLAAAQDSEQRRIAEGLHDDVAQLLAAARMKLHLLARCDNPDRAQRIVNEMDELISQAHEHLRNLSFELASATLCRLGLRAALEELREGMNKRYSLNFTLQCDQDPGILHDETATILFKSARELLFNVVKHADTNFARVFLSKENHSIKLIVEDYGKGFKTPNGDGHWNAGTGLGLFGIRERVQDIGGTIRIESEPGKFTRIILSLPTLDEVTV